MMPDRFAFRPLRTLLLGFVTQAQGTLRLISLRRDDLEDRFPGLLDVLTRAA